MKESTQNNTRSKNSSWKSLLEEYATPKKEKLREWSDKKGDPSPGNWRGTFSV